MIGQKLIEAAGNGISTGEVAEAIDFDGTNDYLSRASDLTGNADGKAFTFSFWVWLNDDAGQLLVNGNSRLAVNVTSSSILIYGKNTSDVNVLSLTTPAIPQNTWVHVLVSLDLTSTSSRYVYINDVQQSVTWTTYTNTTVDRASTGTWYSTGPGLTTRVSNLFMDYTYRNLSVEANRRLFITADLKPAAGQAALNPILYLPMSDPTQPGLNQGTGGNFTLTGTVARSGRGPNQYNAPYSTFDGASDYLSKTTVPTGVADSTSFTFSCCVNLSAVLTSQADILRITNNIGATIFRITINGAMRLSLYGESSTGNLLLQASGATTLKQGRNYQVTISIRLSSTSERFVYINGVQETMTWSNYTSGSIDFNPTSLGAYTVCGSSGTGSNFLPALVGAVWFSPGVYRDLSVEENLAKFVIGTGINAAPADLGVNGELPTGTSPRIYLPMYGNNAGKNYGTGGDFTAVSDPYPGARGPNEFWGNWADFDGTTGFLAKTSALTGVSDGKIFSFSFFLNVDTVTGGQTVFFIGPSSNPGSPRIEIYLNGSSFTMLGRKTNATVVLNASVSSVFTTATTYHVCGCIDLSSTATRFVYINGTQQTPTYTTYVNDTINLSSTNARVGANLADGATTQYLNGRVSELYFTTEYIDFSSEANRLKFRDCFGNPTDLLSAITALSIPNPAVYMRFPPTAFGTNSGTGGNFTVNGTITDGGQL